MQRSTNTSFSIFPLSSIRRWWTWIQCFWALSENLTARPFLRNLLHPLYREEPTLATAIRFA